MITDILGWLVVLALVAALLAALWWVNFIEGYAEPEDDEEEQRKREWHGK